MKDKIGAYTNKGNINLELLTGEICNNNCVFCFKKHKNSSTPKQKTLAQISQALKIGKKNGAYILSIEGGEPTIHKEILTTLRLAIKIGFSEIKVITNGRMLSHLDFAKKFVKSGVTEIIFSIHGHNSKLHDSLTRTPGSFEQLNCGLSNLKKLKFHNVSSHTTIVKQNYKQLPSIAKLLVESNIKKSTFSFVIPSGNAKYNFLKVVPRISKTIPFLYKALDTIKTNNINFRIRYYPLCSLKEHRSHQERINDERLPERTKTALCSLCTYSSKCEGIWKYYLQNYNDIGFKPILKQ